MWIACNNTNAIDSLLPLPISHDAAGFFDQGKQSGNIPGMHAGVEHDVDGTLGDQGKSKIVAIAALLLHSTRHRHKRVAQSGFVERVEVRCPEDCFVEPMDVGHSNCAIILECAMTSQSAIGVAKSGLDDD